MIIMNKILNFCIDHDIEIENVNTLVNSEGVFISLDERIPTLQIYHASSLEDSQQWVINGRKNWRTIREAINLWIEEGNIEYNEEYFPEHIPQYFYTLQGLKERVIYLKAEYNHSEATQLEQERIDRQNQRQQIFNDIAQYHEIITERGLGGVSHYFADADGQAAYELALEEAGLTIEDQ